MKTPIEVKDIRKGDVVRIEHPDDEAALTATEYRAEHDGHVYAIWEGEPHYLIDRPTPPVELPTEPTLGWLTWYDGEESSGLGIHRKQLSFFYGLNGGGATDKAAAGYWPATDLIAFTPAVAVPASALDELRAAEHDAHMSDEDESARNYARKRAINTFLTAVDEANRA